MKVQDLFEAKEVDPEKAQLDFERKTLMPHIQQLLGAKHVKVVRAPGDEDLHKPKKEKHLKWVDADGFDSRYDLYLLDVDGKLIVKMEYNDYGGGTDPVFYAAKAVKVKEDAEVVKVRALSTLAALKRHLRTLGYKLKSEEKTEGALKAWFAAPEGTKSGEKSLKDLKKQLGDLMPEQKMGFQRRTSWGRPAEVYGNNFELHQQGPNGSIYVGVYRDAPAGQLHKMGLDN